MRALRTIVARSAAPLPIFTAFCGLSLTVGCVRFHSQSLSPERSLDRFESRSLSDPALRTFIETNLQHELAPWPLPAWDLTNLTWAGLYFHPDLDVARAQVRVAEAEAVTAGQRPNPTLSATPGYNTTSPSSLISPWVVNFSLDVPIETAGKRGYRTERAWHLTQAAQIELEGAGWRVRSRLRLAFHDLQAAVETERVVQARLEVLRELVRLLKQRLEAGAIGTLEVTSANVRLDAARLELGDVQQRYAEARAALSAAIGVPSRVLAGARFVFPELESLPGNLDSGAIQRQAALSRADVLAALARYAASQCDLQLEIAKQYPDVHLNPGYEFDQGDNKWMLGLSIELPVSNQNQGAIAEATARRQEAAAQFVSIQAKAIGEIEQAFAAYLVARERSSSSGGLLQGLEGKYEAMQSMLASGDVDRLTLTTAKEELILGQEARLESLLEARHAFIVLEDVVQGSLEGHLEARP